MPIYATPQDILEAIPDNFQASTWHNITTLPFDLFVIVACKIAGYTSAEIGTELHLSRKAIDRRIQKAIALLQAIKQ